MRFVPNNEDEAQGQIIYHRNKIKQLMQERRKQETEMAEIEAYCKERGWKIPEAKTQTTGSLQIPSIPETLLSRRTK